MNKKIFVIALAAVLLIAFGGCGKKTEEPVSESEKLVLPSPTPTVMPGLVYMDEPVVAPDPEEALSVQETEPAAEETEAVADSTPKAGSTVNTVPEKTENATPAAGTEPDPVEPPAENTVDDDENTADDTVAEPEVDLGVETNVNADVYTAYEQYNDMSGDEQVAFMESFDSVADFVDWYNASLAEFQEVNNAIEITDGTIDLSQLTGNGG